MFLNKSEESFSKTNWKKSGEPKAASTRLASCLSAECVDLVAVGAVMLLIPGHIIKLGGSSLVVGAVGSIYAGFQLASGPFVGSLSDIKSRKSVLIVSLLVSSAAYGVMGFTESITIILCTRAVLGIFKQTQMLTKALVADYEKNHKKQSEIYGKLAAVSGAGMAVGPIIGGHIFDDFPERSFVIVTAMVCIIFIANAGLASLLPSIQPCRRKANRSESAPTTVIKGLKNSLKQSAVLLYKIKWSEYWDAFLLKGLMGFAMGVYYTNYGWYLSHQFGLSKKEIGYMISFQGVVGTVSSYLISYINRCYPHDKDYSLRNIHVFAMLSIALVGLILASNIYMYILWVIPLAIGNAVGRLITLEFVLKKSHGEHRGTLIGASNSVRSFTGVISPMAAASIGYYFGIPRVNYASLLATIIGVAISYHIRRRHVKDD